MKTRGAWLGAALMAGVAYLLITTPGRAVTVKQHPFLPQLRQVQVGSVTYNVAALGGGNFSVADAANPSVILVFNVDEGPKLRTGDTSTIERDMLRFPADLFTKVSGNLRISDKGVARNKQTGREHSYRAASKGRVWIFSGRFEHPELISEREFLAKFRHV